MKNNFSNFLTKIVRTAAMVIVILSLSACQTLSSVLKEPEVSFHSVSLANINLNGLQLISKLQVKNPNGFEIPFPETDWNLILNNNSFLTGTVRKSQSIRPRESTIIEIPVNLDFLNILNTFASFKGRQNIGYKIALGVKIPIPLLGEKVWNLEHQGSLPLPQLPRLSSPSIKLGTVNTSGAEVLVSLNFENPNSFPLPSPKINYNYSINRNSFIRGEVNNKPLAASVTTPIELKLQVTYADLFRSFASLLTSSSVSSVFSFDCDFGIPFLGGNITNRELPLTLPLRR